MTPNRAAPVPPSVTCEKFAFIVALVTFNNKDNTIITIINITTITITTTANGTITLAVIVVVGLVY